MMISITIATIIGIVVLMESRMISSFFSVRLCCIHDLILASNLTVVIPNTTVISSYHLIEIIRPKSHCDGDLKVIRCK